MRYFSLLFKTFCCLFFATFVSAAVSDSFNDDWRFKRLSDKSAISTNLKHGGFTFNVPRFEAGTLKAVGYINDKKMKTVEVKTAGKPTALEGRVDCSGVPVQAGCNDVVFFYVSMVDKNGTLCTDFTEKLSIQTDNKVVLCNTDGVQTEAGIATLVLRIGNEAGVSLINVKSEGGINKTFELSIK